MYTYVHILSFAHVYDAHKSNVKKNKEMKNKKKMQHSYCVHCRWLFYSTKQQMKNCPIRIPYYTLLSISLYLSLSLSLFLSPSPIDTLCLSYNDIPFVKK